MKSGDTCKCGGGRMASYCVKLAGKGPGRVRYLRCPVCGAKGTQRIAMTAERAAREHKLTNLVLVSEKQPALTTGNRRSSGKIHNSGSKPMELFNIVQVAKALGTTWLTIREWADLGAMPRPVFVAGFARWRRSDLDQWQAAGCPQGQEASPDDWNALAEALIAEYSKEQV